MHRLSRIHCHASFDETFYSLQHRERLDGSHKDQYNRALPKQLSLQTDSMAVATTMISYGGFLGACGWYGAHTSGAMHSLYAGVGSGAVMIMCGANSFGEPKKGDKVLPQRRF